MIIIEQHVAQRCRITEAIEWVEKLMARISVQIELRGLFRNVNRRTKWVLRLQVGFNHIEGPDVEIMNGAE